MDMLLVNFSLIFIGEINTLGNDRQLTSTRRLKQLNLKRTTVTNKIIKRKFMLLQSNSMNSSLSSIENYNDLKLNPKDCLNISQEKTLRIKERISKIGAIPRFRLMNFNNKKSIFQMSSWDNQNLGIVLMIISSENFSRYRFKQEKFLSPEIKKWAKKLN